MRLYPSVCYGFTYKFGYGIATALFQDVFTVGVYGMRAVSYTHLTLPTKA